MVVFGWFRRSSKSPVKHPILRQARRLPPAAAQNDRLHICQGLNQTSAGQGQGPWLGRPGLTASGFSLSAAVTGVRQIHTPYSFPSLCTPIVYNLAGGDLWYILAIIPHLWYILENIPPCIDKSRRIYYFENTRTFHFRQVCHRRGKYGTHFDLR